MANFGQLVEKLLEGFAQGQIHNRNVAERGGDYRLKDQEAAFGKLRGMTQLTNSAEDREFVREDRGIESRRRTAAAKAMREVLRERIPGVDALGDEEVSELYNRLSEEQKQKDAARKLESDIAGTDAEAARDLSVANAPPKFELPPEQQLRESEALINSRNRGPAGPQPPQPKSPEELAHARLANAKIELEMSRTPAGRELLAKLKAGDSGGGSSMNMDFGPASSVQFDGTGPRLPGGVSPAAAPSAGGGCPEGKFGNGGAVVCRGGQWIINK